MAVSAWANCWLPILALGLLSACAAHSEVSDDPAAIEKRFNELLDVLTAKDEGGAHGAMHKIKEDREQELWKLLCALPRYPGGSRIILGAIDNVYLRYHGNLYHGWVWHWPYFDCKKVLKLADRLQKDYPEQAEEALWTKIYCHRIRGLDGNEYPYKSDFKDYATVKAQAQWKSDPDKVRALCRELLEKFPNGKYANRAAELLEAKEIEVTLPDTWGRVNLVQIERQ